MLRLRLFALPLLVTSFDPVSGATGVSRSPTITLTFNQNLTFAISGVTIARLLDAELFEVKVWLNPDDVGAGVEQMQISANTLILRTTSLGATAQYTGDFLGGVLQSAAGLNYAGLAAGNYTFTTGS